MRIAIYNRWLHTQGGGERYSLTLAQTLAQRHAVTLVTHQPVDLAAIGTFLQLDLARLELAVVPYTPTGTAVSALSQDFDGFIGAAHTDIVRPEAPHSAAVVFFPAALPTLAAEPISGQGWYPSETGPSGSFRWSAAQAEFTLPAAPHPRRLELRLAAPVTGRPVRLSCGAQTSIHLLTTVAQWVAVAVPSHATTVQLTTAPLQAAPDPRELGVMLYELRATGPRWPHRTLWHQSAAELAVAAQPAPDVIASYRQIIGISAFTCAWINRRWGLPSALLYPPVPHIAPTTLAREPLILSVGRFFPGGHAKHHALLIQTFDLLRHELPTGWRLVLVGGLDTTEPAHRAYFAELTASIGTAPITLLPNLPAAELDRLWQTARLYWHAGGYGVELEQHPEQAEHFGITVAQALGSGAVPIVYGVAGPAEIVHDGVDGYHWHSIPELIERTRALAMAPAQQAQFRAAGQRAAARFDLKAFEQRVWELFGDWNVDPN